MIRVTLYATRNFQPVAKLDGEMAIPPIKGQDLHVNGLAMYTDRIDVVLNDPVVQISLPAEYVTDETLEEAGFEVFDHAKAVREIS